MVPYFGHEDSIFRKEKKIFSRKFRNFVRYRLASFCENQRNTLRYTYYSAVQIFTGNWTVVVEKMTSLCLSNVINRAYHDEQVAFNEIEYTGRHGCDELADLGRVI
ncbi:hypothetical protein T08_6633 [Trichinella sp. T8]|nr:hypothetical protein T08_6633 [Trichinella sp. T8]